MDLKPRYESMPEVVCTRCQQPVEAFSVLDDDNRSATWWEHVVEPLDDHDVTFEEQPPNDTSFDPRGYGTRLIAPDASADCPSGDTDCTVDCGRCKGGTR